MGKINLIVALKKDYNSYPAAKTIAVNSSRVLSIEAATEDVNGTSTAGTRVLYDEFGDNKLPAKYHCSDVLATLKAAIAALTTTNIKSIDVTLKAEPGTNYPVGANKTKNIPIEFFMEARAWYNDANDSMLSMITPDRKGVEIYRVDQTPAAIVALANA